MASSAVTARRSISMPCDWQSLIACCFLAASPLITLTAAGFLFWRRATSTEAGHVLAPAAIILVLLAVAQARLLWITWHRVTVLQIRLRAVGVFARRFLAGALVPYLAVLAIGPLQHIGYAWLTAVVAWYTILLLPLATSADVLKSWRGWTQRRTSRRLGWLVYAPLLALVVAEASLRVDRLAREANWYGVSLLKSATAEELLVPGGADAWQHLDLAGVPVPTGSFRVAVVGNETTTRGIERNGYLARVGQMLPGLEMIAVDADCSWTAQQYVDWNERLSSTRPDLVLAVVSLCEDLTQAAPRQDWFDWRQLELARRLAPRATASPAGAILKDEPYADDFESFLGGLAPQLAPCRTPIDATMHERWQRTFASLDALSRHCRARQLPLALVLVPGEFQVNRTLCETLARRTGMALDQLDVDLPQRKMTGFAEARQLALIDLLPNLRLCRQSPYERNTATWNEQGNRVAASAIGGWLEGRYGGQLSISAQLTSAP